jgi:hypothetical protein
VEGGSELVNPNLSSNLAKVDSASWGGSGGATVVAPVSRRGGPRVRLVDVATLRMESGAEMVNRRLLAETRRISSM